MTIGTAYRLTSGDEIRAIGAIGRTVETWYAQSTTGKIGGDAAANTEALVRIGAHAMGCGLYDLRDIEIDWLRQQATARLEAGR
jgi:hypothetical protein